jgi:hypothetical protein
MWPVYVEPSPPLPDPGESQEVERRAGMWCGCPLLDCCHNEDYPAGFNCGNGVTWDGHVHSGSPQSGYLYPWEPGDESWRDGGLQWQARARAPKLAEASLARDCAGLARRGTCQPGSSLSAASRASTAPKPGFPRDAALRTCRCRQVHVAFALVLGAHEPGMRKRARL